MEPVYTPVIGFARTVFFGMGLKFRIRGEEHVPRTGGAVLAINHTGYLDFTFAGFALLKHKRVARFMAKKSVFEHKVTGPLMRGMKHIPVDRRAGLGSLQAAVAALRAGEIVGVFPEATMSLSFELKEFKTGAARMAQEAGVPILPCTVWGSQRVWTKHVPKQIGRNKIPIFVTIGEPLWVGPDEDVVAATERLQEVMAGLLEEQQANYPPLTGPDLRFQPARLGGTAPTPEEARAKEEHDRTRTVDLFNAKKGQKKSLQRAAKRTRTKLSRRRSR